MISIPSSSEERLWRLIKQRSEPGADVEGIDRQIWDLFGEEWSILFTDLAGFSRRVAEFGITHFLQIIWEQSNLLMPIVERSGGILIQSHADSMLLIFRRPRSALDCAIAMQRECDRINRRRKPEEQMLLCVGIGYGRILRIGDENVWGAEVNAASKLGEDTAKAGEILVTGAVRDALAEATDVSFHEHGVPPPGADRSYRVAYSLG